MPIQFLPQPANSTITLVFDAGAETRNMSRFSNAAWTFFSTGVDSVLDAGMGFKIAGQAFDPWGNVFAAYDLRAGSGNDLVNLTGPGADRLDGGAGDDTVSGAAGGADTLVGGSGRDLLVWSLAGLAGPVALDVRQASVALGEAAISGFERYDLTLTSAADTVTTRALPQAINNSTISGGAGDDAVQADQTTGDLLVRGDDGNDTMLLAHSSPTGRFSTRFEGGAGDDSFTVRVEPGRASFSVSYLPGLGNDTLIIDAAATTERVSFMSSNGFSHWIQIGNDGVIALPDTPAPYRGNWFIGADQIIENLVVLAGSADDVFQAWLHATRTILSMEVRAGSGNDRVDGRMTADALHGEAGNDTLRGWDDKDSLYGGDGMDSLLGDAGDDLLEGGAGDDVLEGDFGHDVLDGGAGNDTLIGGRDGFSSDIDVLRGGAGHDRLSCALAMDGGDGIDIADFRRSSSGVAATVPLTGALELTVGGLTFRLTGIEHLGGSDANDTLSGNTGADYLEGNGGNDQLSGFGGHDTLTGSSGNDRLEGGQGDDVLWDLSGDDTLDGGADRDTLVLFASAVAGAVDLSITTLQNVLTVPGSAPSRLLLVDVENVVGTRGNDSLAGNAAANWLSGNEGADLLLGRAGDDSLQGGEGGDSLDGGEGADTLNGGAGEDLMVGGSGNDWLVLGTGRQTLDGGAGIDTADFSSVTSALRLSVGITAFANEFGTFTLSSIEGLSGTRFNDTLFGDPGANLLAGAAGRDILLGGDGNDTLLGGEGRDTLSGWFGTNQADGGAGIDTLHLIGARRAGTLILTPEAGLALGGSFTNARETTSFTGIETLVFTDGRLVLDPTDPAMQVVRLYETALARAPNAFELNFWVDRLAEGMALTRAGETFTGGVEFASRWGALSATEFVARVYANSAGRGPNEFEQSFWTAQLNAGMSRGDVLTRLSEYHEAQEIIGARHATGVWDQDEAAASIARLYQAALGRRPDEPGFVHWKLSVDAGMSLPEVARLFVGSPEFQARYGAPDNAGFVTLLYNNVLGRAPDADGFAFWTQALNGGAARAQVVLGFAESQEFKLASMGVVEGGIVFA